MRQIAVTTSKLVGLAATMAALLIAKTAHASCDAGPGPLLWSHPSDGATDVPTNTTLWILPPTPANVRLNGVALATTDNKSFKPQSLLPNTTYKVEVTFPASTTKWQFSFTTNNGPRDQPPPQAPSATFRVVDSPPTAPGTCARLVFADNCYDTPPYKYAQFTVAERPLLWLIRSLPNPSPPLFDGPVDRTWPASCGDPVVIGKNHPDCYELIAVNELGEMSAPSTSCQTSTPDAAPPTLNQDAASLDADTPPLDAESPNPGGPQPSPNTDAGTTPASRGSSGCSYSRHQSNPPLLLITLVTFVVLPSLRRQRLRTTNGLRLMKHRGQRPKIWSVVAAAALVTAAVIHPRPSNAGCLSPTPALLWTHPADGATDVPTNTAIWILPGANSALLNGVAIASDDGRLFKPNGLVAKTHYRVDVPFSSPAPGTLSFSFTTGAGPREIAVPNIGQTTSRLFEEPPELSTACRLILTGRDCFDTPPYNYLEFKVTERPLFWLIRELPQDPQSSRPSSNARTFEAAWPAACGAPLVVGKFHAGDCHQLVAFNERGEPTTSPPICITKPTTASPATAPSSSPPGCQFSPHPLPSPFIAFLATALLYTLTRRRT
jgi:hypothetical protein